MIPSNELETAISNLLCKHDYVTQICSVDVIDILNKNSNAMFIGETHQIILNKDHTKYDRQRRVKEGTTVRELFSAFFDDVLSRPNTNVSAMIENHSDPMYTTKDVFSRSVIISVFNIPRLNPDNNSNVRFIDFRFSLKTTFIGIYLQLTHLYYTRSGVQQNDLFVIDYLNHKWYIPETLIINQPTPEKKLILLRKYLTTLIFKYLLGLKNFDQSDRYLLIIDYLKKHRNNQALKQHVFKTVVVDNSTGFFTTIHDEFKNANLSNQELDDFVYLFNVHLFINFTSRFKNEESNDNNFNHSNEYDFVRNPNVLIGLFSFTLDIFSTLLLLSVPRNKTLIFFLGDAHVRKTIKSLIQLKNYLNIQFSYKKLFDGMNPTRLCTVTRAVNQSTCSRIRPCGADKYYDIHQKACVPFVQHNDVIKFPSYVLDDIFDNIGNNDLEAKMFYEFGDILNIACLGVDTYKPPNTVFHQKIEAAFRSLITEKFVYRYNVELMIFDRTSTLISDKALKIFPAQDVRNYDFSFLKEYLSETNDVVDLLVLYLRLPRDECETLISVPTRTFLETTANKIFMSTYIEGQEDVGHLMNMIQKTDQIKQAFITHCVSCLSYLNLNYTTSKTENKVDFIIDNLVIPLYMFFIYYNNAQNISKSIIVLIDKKLVEDFSLQNL